MKENKYRDYPRSYKPIESTLVPIINTDVRLIKEVNGKYVRTRTKTRFFKAVAEKKDYLK